MDENREAVIDTLKNEYDIQVTSLDLLDGLTDRTYNVNNKQYVVKVYLDPAMDEEGVVAEGAVINLLKDNAFPVASILLTKSGSLYTKIEIVEKQEQKQVHRFIRVQEFLPGVIWFNRKVDFEICETAGRFVGQVDAVLAKLKNEHFVSKINPRGYTIVSFGDTWDIQQLREQIKDDSQKYALCEKVLRLFDDLVAPNLDLLPKQQIHGDCHSRNILVDEECRRITGLVDFGDTAYTCRIFELAVLLPVMLGSDSSPDYSCIRAFMKGYKSVVQLTDLELKVLLPCILGRTVLVMLVAHVYSTDEPDNASYITNMYGPAWDIVNDLCNNEEKKSKFYEAINC